MNESLRRTDALIHHSAFIHPVFVLIKPIFHLLLSNYPITANPSLVKYSSNKVGCGRAIIFGVTYRIIIIG